MPDLDNKLKDILLSRTLGQYMQNADGDFVPVKWEDSPVIHQYIEEIKQVFADEVMLDVTRMQQGMANILTQTKAELVRLQMTPTPMYRIVGEIDEQPGGSTELEQVMTGREWYDGFTKEMGDAAKHCTGCSCYAMEAAKRAARLDSDYLLRRK